MPMEYLYLILGWLGFGATHSYLASLKVKQVIGNNTPRYRPWYRLIYNVVALLTFLGPLHYQQQIEKIRIWPRSLTLILLGGTLAGAGLGFLILALRAYDLGEFSGFDVFQKVKKAPKLRTQGISGWVRHPLYTSTLLLLWGAWLTNANLGSLVTAICLTVYIRVGIHFEERKLLREFGEAYRRYQKRVPMLFPLRFSQKKRST